MNGEQRKVLSDPRFRLSAVLYGVWFLAWLVLELVAVFWSACPWTTLSTLGFGLEAIWPSLAVVFFAGLAVLTVHISFRWPR